MPLIRYPNFTGGNYTVQNTLAARERTINFCPELLNAPGAANRLVLNPTPGVQLFTTLPRIPVRAAYEHNGCVYVVSGDTFYEVFENATYLVRGKVAQNIYPATINANGDAGNQIFITSGGYGYIYDIGTYAFSQIRHDREGQVTGFEDVPAGDPIEVTVGGMLDGFFLALDAKTSSLYCSKLLDGRFWDLRSGVDATYGGCGAIRRSAAPDPWRSFCVNDKMIALFGDKTTEFWFNAGAAPFPFEYVPNALIFFGIQAPFSPQSVGGSLFWVARTADDVNQIVQVEGTKPQIVSTPSTHWALALMAKTEDAIGYSDAYLGHLSYGVTFPDGGRSTVYDLTTGLFHEEGTWIAEENRYDAMRPHYRVYAFGTQLIGDRTNGNIYKRSPFYTADVDGRPMRRVRRAPLLFGDGRVLSFASFELVLQLGLPMTSSPDQLAASPSPVAEVINDATTPTVFPQVELRRSNDGGETWWSAGLRSAGAQGEFMARPTWQRLGATDQFAGFEVVMTSPIPWRIVDALVEIRPGT